MKFAALLNRFAAPLAAGLAVAAARMPVAAAQTCTDTAVNLLPGDLSLVRLNDQVCAVLGSGLSTLAVTGLNTIALGLVLYLGYKLVAIGLGALNAFNAGPKRDEKGVVTGSGVNEGDIIRGAVLSIAQAILIAAFGYFIVANGVNLLYEAGSSVVGGFALDKNTLPWLNFTGPFKGIAATAQIFLSVGVVVFGTFLMGKAWWGYLGKTSFNNASAQAMKMDLLRDAVYRTASIGLVTVLAFFAIRYGPDLFSGIIFGIGKEITDPTFCDPALGNCQ